MIQLPGYACKQALYDKELRTAILAIATCLPGSTEVQDIADELAACTPLYVVQDIYIRLLSASLCYIQGSTDGCEWPTACPFYTVTSLDPCPGMNIYDSRAKGFLINNLVSTNGGVMFTPSTDPEAIFPMSFLETIEFSVVETIVGDLVCSFHPVLLSFLAPTLITVGHDLNVSSNPSLTNFDFTALTTIGHDLILDGNFAIHYSFPALTGIGNNTLISNGELLTLSFPELTTIGGNIIFAGGGITTYSMPNLTTFSGTVFATTNCNLDVATVNGMLVKLDSLGLTGVTINFSGGTSAAPTGAGAAAKTSLTMAGNTVLTN